MLLPPPCPFAAASPAYPHSLPPRPPPPPRPACTLRPSELCPTADALREPPSAAPASFCTPRCGGANSSSNAYSGLPARHAPAG
eukprot:scaffold323911_cov143-Tisochrysis_lutea.AAC.1